VVRHLEFIAAVKATSMASSDYTPPMYHAMFTKHIKPKLKQVKVEIGRSQSSPLLYMEPPYVLMVGIMLMLVCPLGDVFTSSIDMSDHKKTKEYIANEFKSYIEAVGPNNVTQIYSYNASTILGAMDEVVAAYLHLYKQGCFAYILDLFLED
jgi:hypothetical protein